MSAAAHLLRLRVRILPGALMFVCCECCVLSSRGLCDGLITRPEESYRLWRVVVCDQETSWMRSPWPSGVGGLSHQKQTSNKRYKCCPLIISSSRNFQPLRGSFNFFCICIMCDTVITSFVQLKWTDILHSVSLPKTLLLFLPFDLSVPLNLRNLRSW